MGVVYLAQDPFIGRQVAVKVTAAPPPDDPAKFEEYQQQFFNEARAAGGLSHRNIVSVFDAAVETEYSYLVMEYVEGTNLNPFCREKSLLPVTRVVNTIFQCAKALDYAHQNGVVHRDIKPGNILITGKGTAKLSDFGIANIHGSKHTSSGFGLTGSVHYSSPEQLGGGTLTPQTDIFSLGVVMFELLTGAKPYHGDSEIAVVYQITQGTPKSLRKVRPDVTESLELIVGKCLEKNPAERYASGNQLAQDLIASFDHLRNLRDEVNQEEKLVIIKKIPFFEEFSNSELTEVMKATDWVRFDRGSIIIHEGELDDCFYVLISGKATVRKKFQVLASLKAGDCFGEMAYLGKSRRTATITADSDVILMKLNASVIDQTSISTQLRFYKIFSKTLIGRLVRTSEMLARGQF